MNKLIFILFFSILLSDNFPVKNIIINGNNEDRINIVFLGDGYTQNEMENYIEDVYEVTDGLFSSPPYSNYQNHFNVYAIEVPSNESGTDHPGTASDCGNEINNVFYADTYFDSTFDNGDTHRALVINNTFAAYTVLADNTPDWDIVFMMVNTTMYGGTGGTFATFSRNQLSIEIAIHEIGHSFAGLSDEYWAGFQFANENVNMTQNIDPTTIVWNQWLYDNGVGIYQYESPGNEWHRPHQDCKMRYLETPFCSVCSEHTIRTIYSILDPIGNYLPQYSNISLSSNGSEYFQINPIPTIPNTIEVNWFLNDDIIFGNTNQIIFDASIYNPGDYTLKASCKDTTNLVRSDNLNLLKSEVSWNITIDSSLIGDINADGAIDILDVIQSINLIFNNQYNNIADINEDDIINIQDIILIVSIILN